MARLYTISFEPVLTTPIKNIMDINVQNHGYTTQQHVHRFSKELKEN